MKKIVIDQFLALARLHPLIDVRSPGEYSKANIPGSINLPLFSDEERKIVGTQYKQQGRGTAIKTGLDFFGPRMRKIVEAAESIVGGHNAKQDEGAKTILVYCWRGGMRSAGIAWLLDLYGFRVYTLAGGYKSFRNWVLQQFDKSYPFNVLGGYTGSGKTNTLQEFVKAKEAVIDLEGLARHKGSAFGGLGEQPTQEMFENLLALELDFQLSTLEEGKYIWVEDESRRIGKINLPAGIWGSMRTAPLYFLEIPFEERLTFLTEEYGKKEKEEFVNGIIRINKRLGSLNAKNAINFLLEDNQRECFRILLNYYDKWYEKGLAERCIQNANVNKIKCEGVDPLKNKNKLTQTLSYGSANAGS